jgi:hypothetical protein
LGSPVEVLFIGDYLGIEKKWPRWLFGLTAFSLQNRAPTPEKSKIQDLF